MIRMFIEYARYDEYTKMSDIINIVAPMEVIACPIDILIVCPVNLLILRFDSLEVRWDLDVKEIC